MKLDCNKTFTCLTWLLHVDRKDKGNFLTKMAEAEDSISREKEFGIIYSPYFSCKNEVAYI